MKNYILIGVVCVAGILWLLSQPSGGSEELTTEDRIFIRQQCLRELYPAIKETDRRLQYAIALNDWQAIQRYSPIAYRLVEIRRRLESPKSLFEKYDARSDQAEIREIKASLSKGRR